ncbi:hypothetical protein Pan189_02050 [Stratiformator vulcanicus]|uniref:Uncharacterized protein n=1 Tax=Stratiformator vulcanicus TaxID=2527980 RepID=A0A517QW09_9PLAN|nr:hypothetical protein Pan189_02050 [Stratiformator vulcanicus]
MSFGSIKIVFVRKSTPSHEPIDQRTSCVILPHEIPFDSRSVDVRILDVLSVAPRPPQSGPGSVGVQLEARNTKANLCAGSLLRLHSGYRRLSW